MLQYIIGHYIFCLAGASIRYTIDKILNKNNKKLSFKTYSSYHQDPAKEFLDAIIGFVIIGALGAIIFFTANY